MPNRFQYWPLVGNEIRVLRINPLRHGESDSMPIRINLKHDDTLTKKSRLSFWALSYVWGSTDNPHTVYVNGAPLEVTANLHAALVHYRRQLVSGQWSNDPGADVIWIDAICINQHNDSERSLQVPRMTEIYGRCERVLAWLGAVAEEEEAEVAWFSEALAGLDHAFKESWEEQTPQGSQIRRRIEKVLRNLGTRPWFHRAWILQEFVLSVNLPIVLCGHHIIDFWEFSTPLNRYLWHMMESKNFLGPNTYFHIRQSRGQREFSGPAGLASELLTLLDQANKLRATESHDQIYALLGLISDLRTLPTSLAPDYKKPYTTVFHEYTAFLLRETRDTRILLLGPLGTLQGVPSWIPDLRNRSKTQVALGDTPETHVAISADLKTLVVPAISLGLVTRTFPAQGGLRVLPRNDGAQIPASLSEIFAMMEDPETNSLGVQLAEENGMFPASAFKAFEQAIIVPATEVKQTKSENVLKTWQTLRLHRMFEYQWQEMEPYFKIAYEAMKNGTTASASISETHPDRELVRRVDQFLQLAKVQNLFLGLPQFVLSDGQTGHLPAPPGQSPTPTCEVGDMVVIISGCEYVPILVRGCVEGKHKIVSPVALDQYPQSLRVRYDIVDGFRRSFDTEAKGDHPEHTVIKLEIV